MDTLDLIIGAVVLVALLSATLAVGLVRRGRSAAQRTLRRRPPERDGLGEGLRPGVGDDAEEPRDSATRTIDTLPSPDALADPAADTAPADLRPPLDRPAPLAGRLVRLRERLARSNSALGRGLLALLSRDTIDEETWEEVEDTLLMADLGVGPATELVDRLRSRVRTLGERDPQRVRALLREELLALVDPGMDRDLVLDKPSPDHPAVILVVGVNGTGKTTTVGKLARVLVAQDKDVVLGAADTFRAAASEQLATWGDRVGVPTVRSDREGADPAAVAFDAVRAGTDLGADVVIVDTAGRLQNKAGLMDELGKVKRVLERSGPVGEVLLVLDATTGQNGLKQAAVFSQVVAVTGIVLTKLDGTAKGGIVVAVQRELGVPVKLVGLGEGADDLAPFDPEVFVDAILG